MKVYVIRHGESENNLAAKWTGWADVRLTEKGKRDAERAGKLLDGVSFDKIYVSDLIRAIETAQEAIPNCSYETSPLLREVNVGNLANKPLSILTDEQRARIAKCGYTEFDGESNEEFYGRIDSFKKQLEASECETVAVFSHAGWIRGMLDSVVGERLPRKNIYCGNCTVAIFEYAGDIWKMHSWINLS